MPTPVWDLVVVGAGPAGSAAALAALARRPEARVLMLDAAAAGRDKTCGDGVAPEAIDEAVALGVPRDGPGGLVTGCAGVPRLHLVAPGGTAAVAAFARPSWVLPRRLLDLRMLLAAQAAGAELRRERVRSMLVRGDGLVAVGAHLARAVVGADGVHSTVRRALALPANPPWATALAVRGYAASAGADPGAQLVHMVRAGWPAYAWSFPLSTSAAPGLADGRANVGFGVYTDRLPHGDPRFLHRRLAELLPGQPADPATLRAAHLPLSTWRPRQPDGPVLLAGDAASLVHPLTGEGIWYAVVSGRLAGEAALAGAGAGAQLRAALHRRLGLHLAATTLLGRLARRAPALVDAATAAARDDPASFEALVRFGLAGGLPTPRLAVRLAGALMAR